MGWNLYILANALSCFLPLDISEADDVSEADDIWWYLRGWYLSLAYHSEHHGNPSISPPHTSPFTESLPADVLHLLQVKSESEVAQSCPTLCNPMDWSISGFSIHGIFQARVLEWVAISFSRGSFRPRDWTQVSHIAGRRFNLCITRVKRVHFMLWVLYHI